MPQFIAHESKFEHRQPALPLVRMTVRNGQGVEEQREFRQDMVLIGGAAECDLRLGSEVAGLVAVASVTPRGLRFRSLQSRFVCLHNGQASTDIVLKPQDEWACGDYRLRLDFLSQTTITEARGRSERSSPTGPEELAELRAQLERDRQEWEADAERQAESLAVRVRELQEKAEELERAKAEWNARASGPAELSHEALRDELARLRDALYQQYRQRRDAVVAMREAVRHAASKLQTQKREFAAEQAAHHRAIEEYRQSTIQLSEAQARGVEQTKLLEEWHQELQSDRKKLEEESRQFSKMKQEYETKKQELHDGLLRWQRRQDAQEMMQRELEQREAVILQRESAIHAEIPRIAAERGRLEAGDVRLQAQRAYLDERGQEYAILAATVQRERETLQRGRDELEEQHQRLARWENQLGQDRLRLDRLEADLTSRQEQVRLAQELQQAQESAWRERQAALEEQVQRLQTEALEHEQQQEKREALEMALASRQSALDEAQAEMAQRMGLLRKRGERLVRLRQRLARQRQALLDQLQQATHSEAAHEVLQEQLRRRTSSLGQREAQVTAQETAHQARLAEFETVRQALAQSRQEWEITARQEREALEERRTVLDAQAIAQQRDRETLAQQQSELLAEREALQEARRASEERERLAQAEAKEQSAAQQRLMEALPGLMRAAEAVLERLNMAREHLRAQLSEVHAYRQRCQEELTARRQENAQGQVFLEERAQVITRWQDELRLEAAALRQECLNWQGQMDQLEQRWRSKEREWEAASHQIAARSQELARDSSRLEVQAEALEGQAQDVAIRRSEVNRHLADLQRWYQLKLRDLAERKWLAPAAAADEDLADPPDVLPLKSTRVRPDQQLADLLSSMGLVDAITLQALLDEARQQRISLRECLLRNEFLTSYQMELIEAGELESLVLQSLRVIDRIRVGPMETIYRVFDPRLGDEAILRHLSPVVDAERQAEYREMFQRAAEIHHPHVARTLQVLEMSGSPAVVQEWLVGLPGSEWQTLVNEPGVALRLLLQAVEGVGAMHAAGLVHGQLHLGRFLLTASGEIKICGAGEPVWLAGLANSEPPTHADDVAALIELALPWFRGKMRGGSVKQLREFIQDLERGDWDSAESLRVAAMGLREHVAVDESAWQRLLQFLQDRLNMTESPASLKKSA